MNNTDPNDPHRESSQVERAVKRAASVNLAYNLAQQGGLMAAWLVPYADAVPEQDHKGRELVLEAARALRAMRDHFNAVTSNRGS